MRIVTLCIHFLTCYFETNPEDMTLPTETVGMLINVTSRSLHVMLIFAVYLAVEGKECHSVLSRCSHCPGYYRWYAPLTAERKCSKGNPFVKFVVGLLENTIILIFSYTHTTIRNSPAVPYERLNVNDHYYLCVVSWSYRNRGLGIFGRTYFTNSFSFK